MKILSSKIGKVAVLGALAALQMGSVSAQAESEPVVKEVFVTVSCESARAYPKFISAIASIEPYQGDIAEFAEMDDVHVSRDFWESQIRVEWSRLAKVEFGQGSDIVAALFNANTLHAKKGAYGFTFARDYTTPPAAGSKREFYQMRPILKGGREAGSVKCFEKVRQFELMDLLAKELRDQ